MTAFLTVLQAVAPVGLLAALGYGWERSGRDWPVAFVTRLAMGVAVPSLVFTTLVRAEVAPETLGRVALAALIGYAVLLAGFALLTRGLGLAPRVYTVPLAFGNTGNLGMPLALFAFGETGLSLAVAVFAVGMVLQFSLGAWLMADGGGLRALREPAIWAALLGGLFLWQGWALPRWLGDSVALAGQMAIPLMLLTLGVAVARLRPGQLPLSAGLSVLRLGLCLGVGIGVALALAPDRLAFAVIVLQLSTPVPVTAYLMAERLGGDGSAAAGLVLASTLLALISLPVTLAFLI